MITRNRLHALGEFLAGDPADTATEEARVDELLAEGLVAAVEVDRVRHEVFRAWTDAVLAHEARLHAGLLARARAGATQDEIDRMARTG